MKRTKLILVAGCLAALFPLATFAHAGNPPVAGLHQVGKKFTVDKTKMPFLKPDLSVTNIKAIKYDQGRCYLRVRLKNSGPAPIPDSIYTSKTKVGIQMYKDNKPAGGMSLWAFDHNKTLQKPGKSLTRDWFKSPNNLLKKGNVYTIKVVADSRHELAETNEGNNSLTKHVHCGHGHDIEAP